MLVPFTDNKGKRFWINPVHVKLLQQGRAGRTDIILTYRGGWGSNHLVSVPAPIDEVAGALNAAMPAYFDYVPEDEADAAPSTPGAVAFTP